MSERLVAMGVDGAKAGWVAACLFEDDATGARRTELQLFADIVRLAAARSGSAVVAIDVPIGLVDDGAYRACDVAARDLLGVRRATVFHAPKRWMVSRQSYAEVRAEVASRRAAGQTLTSLSAQAFGIVPKIREVDEWLAANPSADRWLIECHPELSFLALNGGRPIPAAKKTAAGQAERERLVGAWFPDAVQRVSAAPWLRREVAIDDMLDAYASLHAALAAVRSQHVTLGDGRLDRTGRPIRMVMPPVASAPVRSVTSVHGGGAV